LEPTTFRRNNSMKNTLSQTAWEAQADLSRCVRNVNHGVASGSVEWWQTAAAREMPDLIRAWIFAHNGYQHTPSGLRWNTEEEEAEVPDRAEVMACVAFILTNMVCTPGVQRGASSYGLKHRVERWVRLTGHPHAATGGGYVSNGAFIGAAALLGVEMEPTRYGSPNVFLALKPRGGGR